MRVEISHLLFSAWRINMSEEIKPTEITETSEPKTDAKVDKQISEVELLKSKLQEFETKEQQRAAKEKEIEETKLKEQNKFKELFESIKSEKDNIEKELSELRKFKTDYDKKQEQIKSEKVEAIAKELDIYR
jgi:DNA repair exonuclease SbcCD ATPase subunit